MKQDYFAIDEVSHVPTLKTLNTGSKLISIGVKVQNLLL